MLQQGIQHFRVPPDAHAQNTRVERVHSAVMDDVRTILLNSELPAEYWAEAANYSAYVCNHTQRYAIKQQANTIGFMD